MSDIIVYGKGKTGQRLISMLQKLNKNAVMFDDASGFDGEGKFDENSLVLVSPGVPPAAKGLAEAAKNGAKIVGETEFCFPYCRGKCISVTGTNGKTTVCEMTAHILRKSDIGTYLLGNGGVPFSQYVLDVKENDVAVLESSSFQLADCVNFAPYVSVFTSLAPDHLNWHGCFENYRQAKRNNFLHQKNGFAIFNSDDKAVMDASDGCLCRKLFYSYHDSGANCFFADNRVVLRDDNNRISVQANYLQTFARHNRSNALAAILACCCVGVSPERAVAALADFVFPPHRLQRVGEICGVTFVDDSKATNVHATIGALNCFEESLALILGGSDKGEEYDGIFRTIKCNVKAVAAVGQTAEAIRLCGAEYGVRVDVFTDFREATRHCFELLKPTGGVVLMSNACASFDSFHGFEERGDYFVCAVEEIRRENQKN